MMNEQEKQWREEFENEFAVPHDVTWRGRYYTPRWADDKSAVFTATVHNGMLEAFKAAKQSSQSIIDKQALEIEEQCRLNGMGAEREARLLAKVEELERKLSGKEEVIAEFNRKLKDVTEALAKARGENAEITERFDTEFRRGKELERKLAEQQAIIQEFDSIGLTICALASNSGVESGHDGWSLHISRLRSLINNGYDDAALNKFLSEARSSAVPEDVAKYAARYNWIRDAGATFYTDIDLPTETRHHVCEWAMDDAIDKAILSAAPKGE